METGKEFISLPNHTLESGSGRWMPLLQVLETQWVAARVPVHPPLSGAVLELQLAGAGSNFCVRAVAYVTPGHQS